MFKILFMRNYTKILGGTSDRYFINSHNKIFYKTYCASDISRIDSLIINYIIYLKNFGK